MDALSTCPEANALDDDPARSCTRCSWAALRAHFGRWSNQADRVVFAEGALDAAVAAYNTETATIDAEGGVLADLEHNLLAAGAAK